MEMLVFKSFLPEIFFIFSILYQLILNIRFLKSFKQHVPVINEELFIQGIFISFCLLILYFNQKLTSYSNNFLVILDYSTLNLKIMLSFFFFLSFIIYWRNFVIQKINFFEYFTLLFLSILGLFLLLNTYDLIYGYLILELQTLCFYVLASFNINSSFSIEAGLKYFVLGSITSGIFLLGCLLIYAFLGTTNFQKLFLLMAFPIKQTFLYYAVLVGVFLIIVTFLVKMVIAPFHFWAPDVYEGSPLVTTVFFSLLPKISIVTLFIKWLNICFPCYSFLSFFLLFIGVFSVFLGAYLAISQKRFKRFIIYSSISQIGFIIMALSVHTYESYSSVYTYIIVYILTACVVWGCLSNFYILNFLSSKNFKLKPVLLIELSSLIKAKPIWACSLLIVFFSFAGIPPLSGFIAKIIILFCLLREHVYFFSVILVLISIISSYYYLRVIKLIFFDKNKQNFSYLNHTTFKVSFLDLESIVYSFCICITLILFFFPSLLILFSHSISLDGLF